VSSLGGRLTIDVRAVADGNENPAQDALGLRAVPIARADAPSTGASPAAREWQTPAADRTFRRGGSLMAESVYRVTEVIGVSSESWEAAARAAVETAAKTVRDLRIAEVVRQDLTIEDGGVVSFRVRLGISFKYDSD
jgi:dodecin